MNAVTTTQRDFTVVRLLDAPRELVFQAWTKPEFLSRWLGPKDFNCPSVTTDFRPGGAYRFSIVSQNMRHPRMQNIASRLTNRSAVRSFECSARQPDFKIL